MCTAAPSSFSPVLPGPPTDLDVKAHSYWQLNRKQNEDFYGFHGFFNPWHKFKIKWEFRQNLEDLQI